MADVKVRRLDGSTVFVAVDDCRHYEVAIGGGEGDDAYERYVLVKADTPAEAKRRCSVEDGEVVDSARRLSRGEVAVLSLNGMEVVA